MCLNKIDEVKVLIPKIFEQLSIYFQNMDTLTENYEVLGIWFEYSIYLFHFNQENLIKFTLAFMEKIKSFDLSNFEQELILIKCIYFSKSNNIRELRLEI